MKITLPNIKGFIQGYWNYWFNWRDEYLYHQLIHRLSSVNIECIINKACIHCGCDMPEKLYEDRGCDEGCYPPAIDRRVWNEIKEDETYIKQFKELEELATEKLSDGKILFRVSSFYYKTKLVKRIKLE